MELEGKELQSFNPKAQIYRAVTPIQNKFNETKAKISNFADRTLTKENALSVLDKVDIAGDVISTTGIVLAPFTEGSSILISGVGEGISLGATAAKHAIKFITEGPTNENVVDASVDAVFEILPGEVETSVKESNLDDVSKKIIRAQVKQISNTAETITTKAIENKRKENEE